ncbi:DUF1178 family protein [Lutibaculum baratangense]|uniref:DUF1178 family protein n=1 Tax=Lutibaculum baratangense AMV1 TaxID=631454 RepID=V4RLG7_9HYPH|nr:DUF1178 family protein [Lutibaculum baratangense]ESR24085.1 hypothetical protein N177_2534 [Lutibaculum baratangense AMV1]
MIRYAVRCERGHEFEGWFRDSEAFDRQSAAGELACPSCGSTDVSKSLMAPAVAKAAGAPPRANAADTSPSVQPHALAADPRARALLEAVKELRRHVIENADYVGRNFAEEARRIHYEEVERRDIYGEASLEETRALLDEGIEIAPIPELPDDKN